MNRDLWEAYICIQKKAETQGRNVDKAPVENFTRFASLLKKHAPPDAYPRLLDIGAGCGAESKAFKDAGYEVTGLTFGIDNIAYAEKHYGIYLSGMDMHDLSHLTNGYFDCAVLIQTFEHALAPFIVVGELYHVLREGGIVLIDIPEPNLPQHHTIWHVNLMLPRQVKWLFKLWGFELIYPKPMIFSNYTMLYKKRPLKQIKMQGYLEHIIKRRREAAIQPAFYNIPDPPPRPPLSRGELRTWRRTRARRYARMEAIDR